MISESADRIQPVPCSETDPEIFFVDVTIENIYAVNTAKKICNSCWQEKECLNLALELGDVLGIWGGMTQKERRSLATKLGITLLPYLSPERGISRPVASASEEEEPW